MKKLSILIISFVLILLLTGCNKTQKSVTKTDNEFIVEVTGLNDTISHTMRLYEGTIVNVVIENHKGELYINVRNSNDYVYRGSNPKSTTFYFTIPETGNYDFSVRGKDATGSVRFLVTTPQ